MQWNTCFHLDRYDQTRHHLCRSRVVSITQRSDEVGLDGGPVSKLIGFSRASTLCAMSLGALR